MQNTRKIPAMKIVKVQIRVLLRLYYWLLLFLYEFTLHNMPDELYLYIC